ncbi:hypothetical protein OIU76_027245 [Salix suchowensis]|nr:hypothetical protein OIU76_027245 [Salix suchowensis]
MSATTPVLVSLSPREFFCPAWTTYPDDCQQVRLEMIKPEENPFDPRKAYQIRTIPKKLNVEPPTWTLKVIGRILEDGVDPDQPGAVQKSNPFYPKFSSFFKRVTIQLDQRLYLANL